MKSIKKISLIIIVLIISVVYFNENMIKTYAEQFTKVSLAKGEIYKSGDVISIQETNECNNYDKYGNEIEKPCKYVYEVEYILLHDQSCTDLWRCNYDYIGSDSSDDDNKYVVKEKIFDNKTYNFWKVIESGMGSYNDWRIYLSPIDYAEPTLNFVCTDDKIDATKSTTCDLILNYNYDVKNLDFKLNVDKNLFDVNEVKGQNDWKVTNTNNDYSLSYTKETSLDKKEITKVKVATIKLTAKEVEKSTELKDNIVVNGVKYTDVMTSRNIDKASETINVNFIEKKEETKEEIEEPVVEEKTEEVVEEVVENPPTGVKSIIGYVLIGSVVGFILIKISKKYKLFS